MSETAVEELPKQEEVAEKAEAEATDAAPAESNDEVEAEMPATKSPSKSPAKSPAKSPTKSPAKSPKKAAEEKKAPPVKEAKASPKKDKKEEEEGDDEEEEEKVAPKKGLFDLPLEIEGTRKRKSTTFLKVEENIGQKHKAPTVAGSGTALEEIPFIAAQMDKEKGEELRALYHICFGTKGKHTMIKRELKKFNGYSFAKDSDEYAKKYERILSHTAADLAHVRRILGLAVGKGKEGEAQGILDFLLKPHDEGKNVPKKLAKRMSAGKDKTPAKKSAKTPSKKSTPAKKKATSKETVESEESDEEMKEEEEEEEEEVKTPKKTPRKTPAKRKAPEPKKTPAKKAKKAASEEDEKPDSDSVSSSDSDEKEEKTSPPPTDDEVKEKISELLKTFDLTTVTMKQMVQAVIGAYPKHPQLVDRTATIKQFIKDKIKDEEVETTQD